MRVVASASNAAVKAARKLARARGRAESGTFLVEAPGVIGEALEHLQQLFVTAAAAERHAVLVEAAAAAGADVICVPDRVLDSIAATASPQGLVGVARLASRGLAEALDGVDLSVVLVEPRNPGNVGTIVRTADAAGVGAVVLAGDAVEPDNPRAVRASAGSLFHLPVVRASWPLVFSVCRDRGLRLVAADLRGARAHTQADLAPPTMLVFGGEAHGLPSAILAACDEIVRVPVHGRAESLNLASAVAVVCYEAARQRAAKGGSDVSARAPDEGAGQRLARATGEP